MGLTISACGWYFLALVLFISSFGPLGGLWLLFYIFAFLAGLFSFLYIYAGQKADAWILESSKTILKPPSIGIPKLVTEVCREKSKLKIDKRMTGSNIIDEVLQELLDYIYRDYIHQWYHKISDNQQFHYDIRHTLQRVVIAFSERAKYVDLIPYITTRLVDDFASHIRLYRRTLTKIKEHRKDDTKPPVERDSLFFDLELEMEKTICRDHICLNEASERQFLQDISEVLMFLLLPEGDFHNKLFRYIVREVVVNGILLPTVNLLSDPDFINQTISWPCKETMFNSESFLTILKTSDSVEELQAIKEKVDYDIARQRSKDTGGDDDTLIKQQLSSLLFVQSMCESRIQRLNKGLEDTDLILPGSIDMSRFIIPGQKLYSLSFDVVLNNNIALSYFIEFMTSIGMQNYLFFYLTVEGYRVSAEQQISAALLTTSKLDKFDLETLHDAATSIFNQYLSEKAVPKLKINDLLVKIVQSRIDRGEAMDTIFDDVQAKVSDLMQEDVRFFPAFKKSQLYIKLLIELDLIQDGAGTTKSDDGQQMFDDELLPCSRTNSLQASSEDLRSSCDSLSSNECSLSYQAAPNTFTLGAYISNTGVCREHGKSYAVYLITVSKKHPDGSEDTWDVYRRYSDFHDLHMILQEKFDSLSGLILPSKKAFDNMNKEFLEKRKVGLNTYLQTLLTPGLLNTHRGLLEMVYQFLEHIHWEREKSELARKMDTIVNPLKSSVRNVGNIVRSMPNNFADGVARVSGGFRNIPNNMLDGVGKMLNVKGTNFHNLLAALLSPDQPVTMSPMMKAQELERGKVSASLDLESDEESSIPLHIMLLLMDEVFDLKSRNQWLRRRIVAILQQIAKTMFGDSINRKIVDHVSWLTCPEQVAEYMRLFRDSLWPSGTIAEPQQLRDHNTKMRTRVVCKAKLFGSLSEELRHLIGLETTRQGVMLVFNMFQHQKLNRRLVYVILEGLLETIFPDNKFQEAFHKIHSQSPRVKQQKKEKASLSSSGSRNSLHRRMRSD